MESNEKISRTFSRLINGVETELTLCKYITLRFDLQGFFSSDRSNAVLNLEVCISFVSADI